jgi:hypothetical protein
MSDGTVQRAESTWHLDIVPQNGLGIVLADFDESGALDIFIANDAVPNSYYPNLSTAIREGAATTDEAVLSGLAYDRDGKSQACMGVACGDADADGRLDLYITNYYAEANVLYHQQSPRLFVDETETFGLRAPSFLLLGFGSQFLDADLDGREDLVLVNGHVDDFTHEGTPYRMRPQLFCNQPGGFEEVFGTQAGTWFDREQLGRGLARLDWNRDGRTDFAVSHLDTPAALLENTADPDVVGRSLALRLVGVESHRDAVGTIVRVRVGDRDLVRHLSAGDGYQASNERVVTFGLGEASETGTVEVQWPGGGRQTFSNLAADSSYLLIEGGAPLRLP